MTRSRSFYLVNLMLVLLLMSVASQTLAQGERSVPWDAPRPISGNLPPRQLSSSAELLALYGVGADQLGLLVDGQDIESGERATLIRILFRLPQFPLDRLESWAADGRTLADLVAEPIRNRGQPLRIVGRVRGIETEPVPQDIRQGVGFGTYYRVFLETDAGDELLVYTRVIPSRWRPVSTAIGAPVQATALFLKAGPGGERAALIFVAPRVGWFPDRPDGALGVTEDHVYLARLGMDLGLFDRVRQRNRKSLDAHDRECFYQLLAAVNRADEGQFARQTRREFELAPLLQQPEQHQGRLLTIDGTARRVTRVAVEEQDIRQRFGIDHYFQIDLFVPLGKQVVRLGRPDDARESPTFVNTFPVTACVRELPPGLAEGNDLRQEIRISAVYFKLWAYRSRFVSSYDQRQLQISPMLIGRRPIVIIRQSSSNRYAGAGLAVVFLTALAGIWLWVWHYSREDSTFLSQTLLRRYSVPVGESLDEMDLKTRDGPDFSGLDGEGGRVDK